MEKHKIVIIECLSSCASYIQDIIDDGYEPILLELQVPEEKREIADIMREYSLQCCYFDENPAAVMPKRIKAPERYEEALEFVRNLNPALIIPGSDEGIIWATRMAHDLGLVGNNPENLPKMRKKDISQEALRQAGLRSIKGKVVSSWEEACKFYEESGSEKIVVKPISGGASVGVFICDNLQQFEQAFRTSLSNYTGNVLLQEYIDGTEYIVNTVSCAGKHRVTAVLRYNKHLISGKARIYDAAYFISPQDESVKDAVNYTLKMLDAIGLEYGPSHNEIMVDENGPVLIEANCRLSGPLLKASYLDKILGDHESRIALSSYLHPERFEDPQYGTPTSTGLNGIIKVIIVYQDMDVEKVLLTEALGNLPGFQYAIAPGNNRFYPKTIDLATGGGIIYLAHEDKNVLEQSIAIIQELEKNSPEKLYKIVQE